MLRILKSESRCDVPPVSGTLKQVHFMKNDESGTSRPSRSLTSLTLGWIADKLRKAELIKKQIADGKYQIDSEKVAAAILNDKP